MYELSRLLNFSELEQVKNFAQQRCSEGMEVTLPVEFKCKDGRVNLLPGDSMYPENPHAQTDLTAIDKTAKQYREGVQNIHRFEFYSMNDVAVKLNFKPPYNHVAPINSNPKKHD